MTTERDAVRPNDASSSSGNDRRTLVASNIGNFLEWYDFGVYGFMAVHIGAVFFPSGNPTNQLLATFAVLAVSFISRPFGGVFFGRLGDRVGRKAVLAMIILIMAAATVGIGLLPGYAAIGIAAPVLLIVLRMIQGLSAGAEYQGASTFVIEHAPKARRGLYGSTIIATVGLGMAAAAATGLLSNLLLTEAQMVDFGWRIPFLLSGPIGLIGLYMRLKLEETHDFAALKEAGDVSKSPLSEVFAKHRASLICLFVAASANGLCYYYALSYFPNMLQVVGGMTQTAALTISVVAQSAYCLLALAVGFNLKRFNPSHVLMVGLSGLFLLALPVFWMMNTGSVTISIVGQVTWLTCQALVQVSFTYLQVSMFPTEVRFSGSALAYSLAYVIFAGTASYVAVWLVSTFDSYYAPAAYSMVICGLALLILVKLLPTTYRRTVDRDYL
ncbi:MAG: MFS transporter [Propionibacteriaceae bacterium]